MLSLDAVRFRSNPYVELKTLAELTADERAPFLELESDPDFYGLFVPRPPLEINLKSVARPTAELFRALATPSRLDVALLRDEASAADVVDLVLDGILEIESGDGFVCGADALAAVVAAEPALPEPHDAAARLSRDALLHAQDLETSGAAALTGALYRYNRIPITPFWRSRLPDRAAVLAYVGADSGPLRALLDSAWIATPAERSKGWLSWISASARRRDAGDIGYKLYVSPRPERMRDVFAVVARALTAFPESQFKIGESAAGLLRPDKLVAYFPTRAFLDDAADVLRRELAGCDAHGVPFSAGLDDSGLLSWGIDPPDNARPLRWLGGASWRLWIARRLGAALAIAKGARSASAAEPWRFAIERVRREGVDVATWTPSPTLWSRL